MSAPNVNQAGANHDEHPVAPEAPLSMFPACRTTTHELNWQIPFGPPLSSGTGNGGYLFNPAGNAVVFQYDGSVRGAMLEILRFSLNDIYTPLTQYRSLVAASAVEGGPMISMSASNQIIAQGINLWDQKYNYYKVLKTEIFVDIEHKGGYHGNHTMPVSFMSYRMNNEGIGSAADLVGTSGASLKMINPSNTNATVSAKANSYMRALNHPRIKKINGGHVIGPAFAYGFGAGADPDATMMHSYSNKTSFKYVYTPGANAEDPTSTNVVTDWTPVRVLPAGTTTAPTQQQYLRIFVIPELPCYSTTTSDSMSAPLDIRIKYRFTVQWREVNPMSPWWATLPQQNSAVYN